MRSDSDDGLNCGEVAPGTSRYDADTPVEEVRCQLPAGHEGDHAALVEWPPGYWPGWPDGGVINGRVHSCPNCRER